MFVVIVTWRLLLHYVWGVVAVGVLVCVIGYSCVGFRCGVLCGGVVGGGVVVWCSLSMAVHSASFCFISFRFCSLFVVVVTYLLLLVARWVLICVAIELDAWCCLCDVDCRVSCLWIVVCWLLFGVV